MPTRDSAPTGAPCWADLLSSDPAGARAFYGELFGWTSVEAGKEYGGYITFAKDDKPIAGCMRNDGQPGAPDGWGVYLAVDSAAATAEAATGKGGELTMPVMQVGDQGTTAMLTDTGGATIGVWQPAAHRGFGLLAEPGAPVWFELHTRDYDASVAFYREVFGWDTYVVADSPEFRYTTLGENENALAGIMDATGDLPDGEPAHWSIYFGVDDTDHALSRIADLGGSVVRGAEDTPYGRLATAADPTGSRFKLVNVT